MLWSERVWGRLLGAIVVCLSWTASSFAQTSSRDPRVAEALYQEGRSLMAEGRYDEACEKLAESHRLDPATGTLLNLAACYESAGRTASAWTAFNEARVRAQQDGRADRVQFAREHITRLEPKLSRLTIHVEHVAPGLTVELDGVALGRAAWGVAIPADPGRHRIEAKASGHEPYAVEVELGPDGARESVKIPRLAPVAAEGREAPTVAPPQASSDQARNAESSSGTRTLGFIIGGAGIAGLAVGGYFGLQAFSRWDERDGECTDRGCTRRGVELGDQAKTAALISDIAFGLGAVGVGIGAYLVLAAPSDERPPAAARVGVVAQRGGAALVTGAVW